MTPFHFLSSDSITHSYVHTHSVIPYFILSSFLIVGMYSKMKGGGDSGNNSVTNELTI